MERLTTQARKNWEALMESQGFLYHSTGGQYWSEEAGYRFTTREAQELEDATNALHEMCLQAVDHVIKNDRLAQFGIPEKFRNLVSQSWRDQAPSIYGRFDLRYDGVSPPKMLEYNADTPTSVLEASRIQASWQRDHFASGSQFNLIEHRLIEAWRAIASKHPRIHFSSVTGHSEDMGNTEYLRSTAAAAGISTDFLFVESVQWNDDRQQFETPEGEQIRTWFKLYPWEWIFEDQHADKVDPSRITCIEPAWKVLLSSKAILPILWELFPEHPNLLPAYFTSEPFGPSYVSKPIFGREGSNVTIVSEGEVAAKVDGPYGGFPHVYQALCPLPRFGQLYALVGSWVIGGKASGVGIRESVSLISENRSRFLPHVVQ